MKAVPQVFENRIAFVPHAPQSAATGVLLLFGRIDVHLAARPLPRSSQLVRVDTPASSAHLLCVFRRASCLSFPRRGVDLQRYGSTIDFGFKRRTDGGASWSSLRSIVHNGGKPTSNQGSTIGNLVAFVVNASIPPSALGSCASQSRTKSRENDS